MAFNETGAAPGGSLTFDCSASFAFQWHTNRRLPSGAVDRRPLERR
jgi:hypothetical protein